MSKTIEITIDIDETNELEVGDVVTGFVGFPDEMTGLVVRREVPDLPTEPGTTGTATVRGVPGVRVMRMEGSDYQWASSTLADTWFLHTDNDITDFVPDAKPEPLDVDALANHIFHETTWTTGNPGDVAHSIRDYLAGAR